jgi:hypothetical protein
MISKFFNHLVSSFGFTCTGDFSNSIIHSKMLLFTIPLASISGILEYFLGLRSLTISAFVVLVILELLTGLVASKKRGEEIVSHKFSRFGFKVFVWLTLLYIVNATRMEYSTQETNFSEIASGFFTWLHGSLFIYITVEYLISVLENLGSITNDNEHKTLIDIIIKKLNDLLKNEKFKEKNTDDKE